MTATNHALTGAIIGLTIHQPYLAIPLAFLSHFVLDATPHFDDKSMMLNSSRFKFMLGSDIYLCILLAGGLLISNTNGWFLACWCAFAATSPDLMWMPHFLLALRGKKWHKPTYALARFHTTIQRYANPKGWILEMGWGIGCVVLLAKLV